MDYVLCRLLHTIHMTLPKLQNVCPMMKGLLLFGHDINMKALDGGLLLTMRVFWDHYRSLRLHQVTRIYLDCRYICIQVTIYL